MLREGPLSPEQAALIGWEIARVVDRSLIAASGRVDLTPDAVLIDGSAQVWLACEPFRTPAGPSATLSAESRDAEAAPQNDANLVYRLGELLEAMLMGRHDDSPAPLAASGRGRRSEQLPRRLLAICRKAKARDPGRRHRSVRRFAREVGAFLIDRCPEAV